MLKGRFLVLLDADLSATADADGKLEPLERAAVALVLFENGAPVSRPPMSNFVVSRPQVVDETMDGRFAPDDESAAPQIVATASVGRGAKGCRLSCDGRFVASINMERTYLPELFFVDSWKGRRLTRSRSLPSTRRQA